MSRGFWRRDSLWVPASIRHRYIGRGSTSRFGGGGTLAQASVGGGANPCDPVLPTSVDTTYSLPGGTLWTPADDAAYQNALDNAALGDVIQIQTATQPDAEV